MRALVAAAIFFVGTNSLADGLASACGDVKKIRTAIADLAEDYGDVGVALNCRRPKGQAEALICTDDHLFLMYRLNSMAEVYAFENATKRQIEHKAHKAAIPACKTRSCICAAFVRSTNDSLGGESPYYVGEGKN